jgi:hypothetical protein
MFDKFVVKLHIMKFNGNSLGVLSCFMAKPIGADLSASISASTNYRAAEWIFTNFVNLEFY